MLGGSSSYANGYREYITFSLFGLKIAINGEDIEKHKEKKNSNYIITELLARQENSIRFYARAARQDFFFFFEIVTTKVNRTTS